MEAQLCTAGRVVSNRLHFPHRPDAREVLNNLRDDILAGRVTAASLIVIDGQVEVSIYPDFARAVSAMPEPHIP